VFLSPRVALVSEKVTERPRIQPLRRKRKVQNKTLFKDIIRKALALQYVHARVIRFSQLRSNVAHRALQRLEVHGISRFVASIFGQSQ
jgi:hypothetical protein